MDLSRAIYRPTVHRLPGDVAGLAAQRVELQTVTVPVGGVEVPLCGATLSGWFADRCTVEVFELVSQSGGELRLRLVVANQCGVDGTPSQFLVAADRGVALTGNAKVTLEMFTASGPLGSWWVLLGRMTDPAADCRFTAAMTLDRAGGGLYVVNGEGTKA